MGFEQKITDPPIGGEVKGEMRAQVELLRASGETETTAPFGRNPTPVTNHNDF